MYIIYGDIKPDVRPFGIEGPGLSGRLDPSTFK